MATYRTIRMSFWSDLYVETLSASEKLLYLYLFTCPHTNNLGVLAVSTRRMAYDTGLTQEVVHAALSLFERDRKIVMDGDTVWLCNFIRHQCSTSPKILASLRAASRRGIRRHPQGDCGALSASVRGRAVPFR